MGTKSNNWISHRLALAILVGCILVADGLSSAGDRESRKLFGGYKITPKFCNASITLPPNDPRSHGPTICMFNHECIQRNGEVVGACMDGFLFGTCCQLHGDVLTPLKPETYSASSARPAAALSYQQYGSSVTNSGGYYGNNDENDESGEFKNKPSNTISHTTAPPVSLPSGGSLYYDNSAFDDDSSILVSHSSNSLHPVSISTPASSANDYNGDGISSYFPHSSSTPGTVTKGELYLPPSAGASQTFSPELPALLSNYGTYSDDVSISTEKNSDFTAAGINHITNTLLNERPNVYTTSSLSHSSHFSPSSNSVEEDGQEINNYGPTSSSFTVSSTEYSEDDEPTTPRIVKITYAKPQFKPKPTEATTGKPNKYVLVHTISHESETSSKPDATISDDDIESIESIILMLNGSNAAGPEYDTGSEKIGAGSTSYQSVTPTYGSTSYGSPSTYGSTYGSSPSSYESTYGSSPSSYGSTQGASSTYGSTQGSNPTSFFLTTKLPSSAHPTEKRPSSGYIITSSSTRHPTDKTKKPTTSYVFSTTLPPRKPEVSATSASDKNDDFQLVSSTINSIQFPSSTLQPPSYSYSTTSRPPSTIYLSSSTYGGSLSSTNGGNSSPSANGGSSSVATRKPSTSYISSTTPVTRRPVTIPDEVIITPTTKKQTKPTKKIITKSPSSQTTVTGSNTPSTSYVTGTPARPRPASSTTQPPSPPKTSYVYTSQTTRRPTTSNQPTRTTVQPSSSSSLSTQSQSSPSTTQKKPSSPILIASYGNDYIQSTTPKYPEATPINHGYVTNNGFVQVSTITDRPNPTVHITPKPPGPGGLVTTNSWSRPPPNLNQYTVGGVPGSSSYIYQPVSVTRPGYYSTTPHYPPVSNDFDDSGYFGVTVRPTVEHIVTQTSVYNVVDPAINSYGQQVSSTYGYPVSGSTYGHPISGSTYGQPVAAASTYDSIGVSSYGEPSYQSTPSYPSFNDHQTSPDNLINFPPVRNPNLNMSASGIAADEQGASTPAFAEDSVLDDKMGLLVNKIVQSLQGNFDTLADMVYDRNESMIEIEPLEDKPSQSTTPIKKPVTTKPAPTKKPVATKKPPAGQRPGSTRPQTTTKRPVKGTTTRRPPTKRPGNTTIVTKKPTTVTKRPATKPTKKLTTTTSATTIENDEYDEDEEEDVGQETETEQEEAETHFQGKLQCGVRPQVKSGRIVGGKSSAFGEWPWQVLVRESTWLGLFTKNKCGGVLITNEYVMTAAHCQPGFLASLVAVFGEYDISGELEAKRSVTKNVKNVVVHRQYDAATFENDLALLQLESPIHYDAHIVPICMPADAAEFTGRMATVTGWGRLKYGGGVPSVLQEVQVPVIENSVCQEMFNTAGHNKKILPSFLCAGYANGQKDSCEGDSGGPLVLQRPDGRWELAGTVSHGIKCAAPYLPGVYMRTTFYKPWLQTVTGVH